MCESEANFSRKERGEEEKECVLLEVEDEEEEDGALVSHLSIQKKGLGREVYLVTSHEARVGTP